MRDRLFWKNKKVLIVGHTGFVGTWLSMVLKNLGVDLCGIALPAEKGSLFEKVKDDLHINDRYLDIRDKNAVYEAISSFRPDIVFHLAAFGFIQECISDPENAISTNTVGTYNVLSAINRCSVIKAVIVASSDKVYKNSGDHCLFNENDELGGVDPYSASKTCQDIICRCYYDTYLTEKDIGMCVVRPSNILGGGDHHENRLIPSMFLAGKNGTIPVIRNPKAVRPWQDILDMCDAYLFLGERAYSERMYDVVNVGPKPEGVCTVGSIADRIGSIFGQRSLKENEAENTLTENMWLGLSIEKILSYGWSPKMTIDDTLKNVYKCYVCERDDRLYDICMKQIIEYSDKDER